MNIKLTKAQLAVVEVNEWTDMDLHGDFGGAEYMGFICAYDSKRGAILTNVGKDHLSNAANFLFDFGNCETEPANERRAIMNLASKVLRAAYEAG